MMLVGNIHTPVTQRAHTSYGVQEVNDAPGQQNQSKDAMCAKKFNVSVSSLLLVLKGKLD